MPGLRQAIRELAAEERRGLTGHPTPNELVDDGTFPDPQSLHPDERLPDDTVTAEWKLFRERTGEIRQAPPGRPAWAPWALAASLLLAVLGLTVELTSLRRQVEDLSRPRAGIEIVTLFPRGEAVERSSRPEAVAPPSWADRLVLVLDAPAVRPFATYEAAIQAENGAHVWRGGGLSRSPEGTLALEVPRRLLPAGAYCIHLSGIEPTGPVLVADFDLRLAG